MRRERHGFYGSQFYDLQCAKIMNSLGNEIETGTPNVSHCFFTSTFSCKNAKLISENCWPDRPPGHVRFTPESEHWSGASVCPLCAKSRHGNYFDSRLICCPTTTGSVKANVEPCPGCDSTQILPPCISMIRLEMASPKPVPPFLRVMALSACWNCPTKMEAIIISYN